MFKPLDMPENAIIANGDIYIKYRKYKNLENKYESLKQDNIILLDIIKTLFPFEDDKYWNNFDDLREMYNKDIRWERGANRVSRLEKSDIFEFLQEKYPKMLSDNAKVRREMLGLQDEITRLQNINGGLHSKISRMEKAALKGRGVSRKYISAIHTIIEFLNKILEDNEEVLE